MPRRVAVIGTGWVGSSVAISTLQSGVADELLLNDIRAELAEGEAMDLAQGSSFYPHARVRTADLDELTDVDAVVVSAGRGGTAGESRLELLQDNARVIESIGRRLRGCRGSVIVVTNPVDVLTDVMTRASGLPPERVLGTGTMLETARLRQMLGGELDVDPSSVHAYVIGEHGDSNVALWSNARIGGRPLRNWPEWQVDREQAIAERVRTAAYEIIRRKGATNHAIGLVTANLLRSLLRGERRVLTVSRVQEGALGVHGVALSLPAIVGRDGATEVLEPEIDAREHELLGRSAAVLRRATDAITAGS